MNKRLFAIGDIHGCFDSLKELIEHKIRLQKNDKLVLLGDYIDRGDKSKEVIDFIIKLLEDGYDLVPLLGNHEAMLLDAHNNKENIFNWMQNGGAETLRSFEISSLSDMESKYLMFFKDLRCYYSFGEFLFVHAGFNDNIVNPFEDKYSMLWNCQDSYTNTLLINKTIVHGHCLISVSKCEDRVASKLNTINIDTGCVFKNRDGYGILTALDCYANRIVIV